MAPRNYQQCSRCVMDTTDPEIHFDVDGVCSHCHEFEQVWRPRWHPDAEGAVKWANLAARIREEGKNKPYDCIIGLSGGADSSYLAVKMRECGLRPLAVHVDCGWNSELAVHNIEQIVTRCEYDLHTHVVDWEEVKDLQIAFLRSGVANQDAPQDHAFFAALYATAVKNNIRYVISGGNIATESIFPKTWHGNAMDLRNLRAIHRRFGAGKLRSYPTASFFAQYVYYPFIRKMSVVRPLNYMPYNKPKAMEELVRTMGYKEYGRKHGESIFTKFFQNYYLPTRFGIDKRLPHLSSMICSNTLTREEALAELAKPLYEPDELAQDREYFCKKLSLTSDQLDELLNAPKHDWREYPNSHDLFLLLKKIQSAVERVTGRRVKTYS